MIGVVAMNFGLEKNEVWKVFLSHPVPFFGGFLSGLLRLDLKQDPLRSWLESQGLTLEKQPTTPGGPTTISIE